jgi:hypothetical protein
MNHRCRPAFFARFPGPPRQLRDLFWPDVSAGDADVHVLHLLEVTMKFTLCPRFALSLLLTLSASAPAWSQAEISAATPAGVRWEIVSQPTMTMGGMTMPMAAQTSKVCAPANATEPPGGNNEERGCVGSDFTRDGLTVSWTSVCTGPPAMTGQGQLTYETEAFEAYSGTLNYAFEEGTMLIALTGKVIGTCDNPMSP